MLSVGLGNATHLQPPRRQVQWIRGFRLLVIVAATAVVLVTLFFPLLAGDPYDAEVISSHPAVINLALQTIGVCVLVLLTLGELTNGGTMVGRIEKGFFCRVALPRPSRLLPATPDKEGFFEVQVAPLLDLYRLRAVSPLDLATGQKAPAVRDADDDAAAGTEPAATDGDTWFSHSDGSPLVFVNVVAPGDVRRVLADTLAAPANTTFLASLKRLVLGAKPGDQPADSMHAENALLEANAALWVAVSPHLPPDAAQDVLTKLAVLAQRGVRVGLLWAEVADDADAAAASFACAPSLLAASGHYTEDVSLGRSGYRAVCLCGMTPVATATSPVQLRRPSAVANPLLSVSGSWHAVRKKRKDNDDGGLKEVDLDGDGDDADDGGGETSAATTRKRFLQGGDAGDDDSFSHPARQYVLRGACPHVASQNGGFKNARSADRAKRAAALRAATWVLGTVAATFAFVYILGTAPATRSWAAVELRDLVSAAANAVSAVLLLLVGGETLRSVFGTFFLQDTISQFLSSPPALPAAAPAADDDGAAGDDTTSASPQGAASAEPVAAAGVATTGASPADDAPQRFVPRGFDATQYRVARTVDRRILAAAVTVVDIFTHDRSAADVLYRIYRGIQGHKPGADTNESHAFFVESSLALAAALRRQRHQCGPASLVVCVHPRRSQWATVRLAGDDETRDAGRIAAATMEAMCPALEYELGHLLDQGLIDGYALVVGDRVVDASQVLRGDGQSGTAAADAATGNTAAATTPGSGGGSSTTVPWASLVVMSALCGLGSLALTSASLALEVTCLPPSSTFDALPSEAKAVWAIGGVAVSITLLAPVLVSPLASAAVSLVATAVHVVYGALVAIDAVSCGKNTLAAALLLSALTWLGGVASPVVNSVCGG